MQKHRIFIAIKLPESVKKELLRYREKWPDLPAKWVKENNIHITLNFLGYVVDEELMDVFDAVENVSLKHSAFYVKLNKICYGPENKIPPKMIWTTGEAVSALANLKNDLDTALDNYENRGFKLHITLARIRAWDWRRIDPDDVLQVAEDIDLGFKVNSIEVMESVLKKGGPEYTILQSFMLK